MKTETEPKQTAMQRLISWIRIFIGIQLIITLFGFLTWGGGCGFCGNFWRIVFLHYAIGNVLIVLILFTFWNHIKSTFKQ